MLGDGNTCVAVAATSVSTQPIPNAIVNYDSRDRLHRSCPANGFMGGVRHLQLSSTDVGVETSDPDPLTSR